MVSEPRRPVLMCAPAYLPALTGEASWTADGQALDVIAAHEQWRLFRDLVCEHVGPVHELQAEPWAPAMTFTRDLALVIDGHVILVLPHLARGAFEAPLARQHLANLGYEFAGPQTPLPLDGGNVIADGHGRLLIGVTKAHLDDQFVTAVRSLEEITGRTAVRVPLTGGRFPHVDMAICELPSNEWLVYPKALPGFDLHDPAWQALFRDQPVICVDDGDGARLGCNLLTHGDVAIGPPISTRLLREIEQTGMQYIATPLTELVKAGGGAHCLTLELPRQTAPPRVAAPDGAWSVSG